MHTDGALAADAPATDGRAAADAGPLGFAPSNGVTAQAGTAAVTLVSTATFDSDTGTISGGGTDGGVLRLPGEGVSAGIGFELSGNLAVFSFESLDVAESASVVHFVGTHPVALAAHGTVKIQALLDLEGDCSHTGFASGGSSAVSGLTPDNVCTSTSTPRNDAGLSQPGNGGAGYAGPGGAAMIPGGATCSTNEPTLVPLLGGFAGGNSVAVGGGPVQVLGGNGGGAIQIVAGASIVITGTINAGGCGGDPGSGQYSDGAGGGSGGAILLEAPVVSVGPLGVLAANGGGGGAPAAGTAGLAGLASASAALGGTMGCCGAGGYGGYGFELAGGTGGAGGGGGACGRIRINTATTLVSIADGGVVSPSLGTAAASTGALTR